MAQIKNNPLLTDLSGALGKTIIFKQWQGKLIVSNMPAKRSRISEKQKASSERFRAAGEYARHAMTIPEVKAEYEKGITPNKNAAYRVAMSDYLNAPVVHYIKVSNDTITIKATDDFKVTGVHVQIFDSTGKLLMKGDAIQQRLKPEIWKYKTEVKLTGGVIKVTAVDRPGNEVKGEVRV